MQNVIKYFFVLKFIIWIIFHLIFWIMYYFILCTRIVLEADSTSVVQRVAVRSDDIPLGEQTVAQVRYFFSSHPLSNRILNWKAAILFGFGHFSNLILFMKS